MPKSFRGYEIVKKIGAGGMSTLYLGIQTALGRKVVVKILHPSLAEDESFIARFEREARAASSLGHSNIVTVIDFGSEDDVYFIVMEYIEGMDLTAVLDQVKPLPPEVGLTIVEEIALGLEAAHSKGVIHRDIKPGNVLLTHDGVIKIVDFGLARQRSDLERLSSLTVPGSVFGTPAYMSPEQATGHPADHRADIFSLGALAYDLFTGERAFPGDSYSEIREQVIGVTPPAMRTRSPLVSPEIDTLVARMLEKDPARRYQSMTDVLKQIEHAMDVLEGPMSVLKYRRKYMQSFAQDPKAFSEELRRNRLTYHMDRAQYYMNMGLDQIDDAITQFQLVLSLDPHNKKARTALVTLENERRSSVHGRAGADGSGDDDATVVEEIDRTIAASGTRPPGTGGGQGGDAARGTGLRSGAGARPRRAVLGLVAVVAIAAIAVAVAVWWTMTPTDGAMLRISSRPPGAEVLVRAAGDAEFRRTGLVTDCSLTGLDAGLWDVRLEMAGRRAREVRIALDVGDDRVIDVDLAVAGEEAERPAASTDAASTDAASTDAARADSASGEATTPVEPPVVANAGVAAQGDGDGRAANDTPPSTAPVREPAAAARPPAETGSAPTAGATSEDGSAGTAPARPRPAPRSPGEGHVLLLIRPYADVYVDGKLEGLQKRRLLIAAPAGSPHTIQIRHPSLGTHVWTDVTVSRGDTLELRHVFTP